MQRSVPYVLLVVAGCLAACGDGSSHEPSDDTPDEPTEITATVTAESLTYKAAFGLYKSLRVAGFSDCQAYNVGYSALHAAIEAAEAANSYDFNDLSRVIPALVQGGLQGIGALDVADAETALAVETLAHGTTVSLRSAIDGLEAAARAAAIAIVPEVGIANLHLLGVLSHGEVESYASQLVRGSVNSLDELGLSPAGVALAVRGISAGSAVGATMAPGHVPSIEGQLPDLIATVAATAVSSLNSIGLLQEQKGETLRLIAAGIASGVDASRASGTTMARDCLLAATQGVVSRLGDAQVHASIVPLVIHAIMHEVYDGMGADSISQHRNFLGQLRASAVEGLRLLDSSDVPGGKIDVPATETFVNSYNGTYENVFADAMPDCTAEGEHPGYVGIWQSIDGTRITITGGGACWVFSDESDRAYVATEHDRFAYACYAMGTRSTVTYVQFDLHDVDTEVRVYGATFGLYSPPKARGEYHRMLMGEYGDTTFAEQRMSIEADTSDIREDTLVSFANSAGLGTGLGGLGGISSVLTTVQEEDDASDGTVIADAAITGFFAAPLCEKANVKIQYFGDDTAEQVIQDVGLPDVSPSGLTITWESDSPAIISEDGRVFRPPFVDGDAHVTLTATLHDGEVTDSREYLLTVVRQAPTDAEAVAADTSELHIGLADGDSSDSVTADVLLPNTGYWGSFITWASDASVVVSSTGVVTRPFFRQPDVVVTLSATIARGEETEARVFRITVTAVTFVRHPPDSWSVGTGLVTDASRNIFTVGHFESSLDFDPGATEDLHTAAGGTDVFVTRFDGDGAYSWTGTLGGGHFIHASEIALDGSGDLVITGHFENTADLDPTAGQDLHTAAGGTDVFVTKLGTDGSYRWSRTLGGVHKDESWSIKTDATGALYITGNYETTTDLAPGDAIESHTSNGKTDVFVTKLDGSGNHVWTRAFGGTGSERGAAVGVSPDGSVVVAGDYEGFVDFEPGTGEDVREAPGNSDVFITKLSADGNRLWTQTFCDMDLHQANRVYAKANDLIIDAFGNIVVTGRISSFFASHSCDRREARNHTYITKINADGSHAWTSTMQGSVDDPIALAATSDPAGNVYVTGYFVGSFDFDFGVGTDIRTAFGHDEDSPCYPNLFVTKLGSDGSYVWTRTHSGARSYGYDVAVDSTGAVVITGKLGGHFFFEELPH